MLINASNSVILWLKWFTCDEVGVSVIILNSYIGDVKIASLVELWKGWETVWLITGVA